MAGVSAKEIRNRIRTMESTKQITKAMEMVAASKLRHAQQKAASSRPYFEILRDTIREILGDNTDLSSPYLVRREVKRWLYVVIAGDRGLAGGYNSNILKLVQREIRGKDAVVLPVGKMAVDHFKARGFRLLTERYHEAAGMSIGDCFSVAKQMTKGYLEGEYDEIVVAYTDFQSALSQTPVTLKMLPLEHTGGGKKAAGDILYEPNSLEVFDAIVPEYLGGLLYGALSQSCCAEQAARRMAMDAATRNAEDMMAELCLKFNQARQAAITNELMDIVAGS